MYVVSRTNLKNDVESSKEDGQIPVWLLAFLEAALNAAAASFK